MKLTLDSILALLPPAETEYRFHATRRWRFDYAWPDYQVALEYEGGVFSGGRHVRGKGFEGDIEKYNEAEIYGWLLIRCTAKTVRNGEVLRWLERALRARGAAIPPRDW